MGRFWGAGGDDRPRPCPPSPSRSGESPGHLPSFHLVSFPDPVAAAAGARGSRREEGRGDRGHRQRRMARSRGPGGGVPQPGLLAGHPWSSPAFDGFSPTRAKASVSCSCSRVCPQKHHRRTKTVWRCKRPIILLKEMPRLPAGNSVHRFAIAPSFSGRTSGACGTGRGRLSTGHGAAVALPRAPPTEAGRP